MAGSKLENIQDKVNEYLDRVQTLLSAGQFTLTNTNMTSSKGCFPLLILSVKIYTFIS